MFGRILLIALVVAVAWSVVARASTAAGPERAYVVQPGDTLWEIAEEHYGGDPRSAVWRIEQRNGVRAGELRAGHRLVLP